MLSNIESKFNEACIKNLSTYARTSALKLDSKTIPEEFKLKKEGLTYEVNELSSQDILLIAQGQLIPQTALKYFVYLSEEKGEFK